MATIKDVLDTNPEHAIDTVARALKATDWPSYLITERFEIRVPENSGRVLNLPREEIAERYLSREQLLNDPPSNFHLVIEPLAGHKLTLVRSVETTGRTLRDLVDELSRDLAVAATKDLPQRTIPITTPVCDAIGTEIDEYKPTIVPIWRAGNSMLLGMQDWLTHSKTGSIGMYRNHETLLPIIYFVKLPYGREKLPSGEIKKRTCYICDPMLATGVSSVAAVEIAKSFGYESIKFIALISAPQGVNSLLMAHPEVEIYTMALDEGLTENGYIVPGMGDAGDRLTGTK